LLSLEYLMTCAVVHFDEFTSRNLILWPTIASK
jgi:hypothetical protein